MNGKADTFCGLNSECQLPFNQFIRCQKAPVKKWLEIWRTRVCISEIRDIFPATYDSAAYAIAGNRISGINRLNPQVIATALVFLDIPFQAILPV